MKYGCLPSLRLNRKLKTMAVTQKDQRVFYTGLCNLCGATGRFEGSLRLGRNQFPCLECGASLRYRDQTAAILQHFASGRELSLDRFINTDTCQSLSILEIALRSPFIRRFRQIPSYTRSYQFNDVPSGELKDGVVCQNLERTSFDDETFDLVVSSDLMDHVPDWRVAVAEIGRILRPGGAHVFSVPIRWPFADTSTQRARIVDGALEHLLEPRYRGSGTKEASLVFTDFGLDLLTGHNDVGLRARFFNSHFMLHGLHRFPSVIAAKPRGVSRV